MEVGKKGHRERRRRKSLTEEELEWEGEGGWKTGQDFKKKERKSINVGQSAEKEGKREEEQDMQGKVSGRHQARK